MKAKRFIFFFFELQQKKRKKDVEQTENERGFGTKVEQKQHSVSQNFGLRVSEQTFRSKQCPPENNFLSTNTCPTKVETKKGQASVTSTFCCCFGKDFLCATENNVKKGTLLFKGVAKKYT